jgi:hypothetical protein
MEIGIGMMVDFATLVVNPFVEVVSRDDWMEEENAQVLKEVTNRIESMECVMDGVLKIFLNMFLQCPIYAM